MTDADASDPAHGQLGYLQIPAVDVGASARFYRHVFGWHVDGDRGFEAPGLIGQWVTDRSPARDAGMLAWIHVDSIDAALQLVRAHGGTVVEEPTADGPDRWLATVGDPAGNAVGIAQNGERSV
ncbi:MAG: Glyoxalase/bleomycin resistance protein/dioxygenase [Actinomycetia bacterium]|nr:Glyoxalase/bleomycin resistance protein/dioxygenase [Actinomycetes bacterium]